jgi:hypothetical protein
MAYQGSKNDNNHPRAAYNGSYGGNYAPDHPTSLGSPPPPLYANSALGLNPNYIQQPGPPPALSLPSEPFAPNPEAPPFVPSSSRATKGLRTKKENKARKSCKHRKNGCLQFWDHTTDECKMSWVKQKERNERKKRNKAEREAAKEKEAGEEGEKKAAEETKE